MNITSVRVRQRIWPVFAVASKNSRETLLCRTHKVQ